MVSRVASSASPPRAAPLPLAGVAAGLLPLTIVGLLVLLTLALVLRSIGALSRPDEIMYGESIIYDHVARLLRGEALYQPIGQEPYTVAAYTPVFYYLAALARIVGGPGFAPGRLVSLASGIACVALVWWLARRIDGRRRAGWLAALLFLALGLPWVDGSSTPWPALYKEDALGVAFSLGSIAVLASRRGRRGIVVAGLLAGLAVLTKQSLVAPLLAGVCWLWWRNRWGAALFAGACLVLVLVVGAGFEVATRAFIANTVLANANPLQLGALTTNLATLLLYQVGALFAAGYGLRERSLRASILERGGPLAWYWLAAFISVAGLAKVGSNHNYWMEGAAVTAIMASLAVWHAAAGVTFGRRPLVVLALTPMLWLSPPLIVAAARAEGPAWLWSAAQRPHGEAFAALVARVRSTDGIVLADPLDVIALADRPVYLEPYVFNIMAQAGQWDPAPVVERICEGDVRLAVFDRSLDAPDATYHGYTHWPQAVRVALRQAMVLDGRTAGRYVYVPRQHPPAERAPECG